jgi:DNA repair protein RadC
MLALRDFPIGERPRERMARLGPSALSDSELLAIIIRTGTQESNVIDLSREILKTHSLKTLCQSGFGDLKRFKGISDVKAGQILAVIELSKRIHAFSNNEKEIIEGSKDVANLMFSELRFCPKEQFYALLLDTRCGLIKKEQVSLGNLNTSIVHPREIFRSAITERANSIILVHNHPSGNPTPSNDDIQITKQIVKAGNLVGIRVVDHIVIGESSFVSMSDTALVSF